MDTVKNIEFSEWSTPLIGKEVHILSAGYSKENEFGLGIRREKHYLIENSHFQNPRFTDLLVRVFCVESEEVYQIQFSNVGGFRILDEHGLQEVFASDEKKTGWPTFPTFRLRHHGWTKESPASFDMGTNDGWSYMVMTGWDFVEVLTIDEPRITLESRVNSLSGPLSNPILNN